MRGGPRRRAPTRLPAFALSLALALALVPAVRAHAAPPYPFNNASLPAAARALDLLQRLTLQEKVGMIFMDVAMAYGNDSLPAHGDLPSTAVPRLGVPQFNWMSQVVYRGAGNGCDLGCCTSCPPSRGDGGSNDVCCHDGVATQLPQGTGVAASWNTELVFRLGVLASDESRGIQNGLPGSSQITDYRTGASSVINILRDGRWGRAPETYGECPVLTGEIALALNKGLSGFAMLNATARQYGGAFKVLPVLRHFVAYAGPDSGRFGFDAVVSEDDLRLTYLPAWRRLAAAGAMGGVMSAISSLNSIPSAAHRSLLKDVLKGEWGFDGFVISDCDTIASIATSFHYTASVEQAAAAALQAGGDLNCGPEYELILNATAHGLVSEEADIDPAVLRLLLRRVQTGDLDLSPQNPYSSIPYSVVDSPAHRRLARQAVRESVVLLHNGRDGAPRPLPLRLLPGAAGLIRRLLVVGPTANDSSVQAHTYHGTPAVWTTVLAGLRSVADPSVAITFLEGCSRSDTNRSGFAAAVAAVADADAVVYVGGLEASMEEEDTDRDRFALPGVQLELVQELLAAAQARASPPPVVAVVISGGPVSEPLLANARGLAWLWASYFGQAGEGIADVIAGAYSPSGRLPFTVPVDASQLGDITDYSMRGTIDAPFGRTYRYLIHPRPFTGGFGELAGTEAGCDSGGGCLQDGPDCDNTTVTGQCSFPREFAVALCGAWPACVAVTCNGGAEWCQARGVVDFAPRQGFTTYVRSTAFPSLPLYPFAFGLSYADLAATHLVVGSPSAALGDTVAVTATVANGAAGPDADFVVAVFGVFLACDGSPSPVPALPLRTLLAFTKVHVAAGEHLRVPLQFTLAPLFVPGVERQSWPGVLRLWAGDGGPGAAEGADTGAGATATLRLALTGDAGCGAVVARGGGEL